MMKLASILPIKEEIVSNTNKNRSKTDDNKVNCWHNYITLSIGLLNIIYFIRADNNSYEEIESDFYNDICKHKEQIKIALLLSFGASISLGTDIIGETIYYVSSKYFKLSDKSRITMYNHFKIDILERFIILCYTLIANSCLYVSLNSRHIERLFMYYHMVQHLGYICCVHSLCVKLDSYFAKKSILFALIILLLTSTLFVEATGYKEDYNIFNVIGIASTGFGFSIFVYHWFVWLKKRLLSDKITITDFRILLYLVVTCVSLFTLPIVPGVLNRFSYRKMGTYEASWLIYINFIFNVLFGSLPSRITAYVATLNKENELESRKQLTRFFCHELRSPLNVAKIGVSLLEKGKDDEIICDIDSEIEAAIGLLNNLLEAEKIDDSKLVLVANYCSCSFINSTIKKYALLAAQKKISYEMHNLINANETKYMLHIDKYKIEQVIRNLISNSIKFTPEGGLVSVTLTVEVGNNVSLPGSTDRKLVVEVKDNGIGVSVNRQCEMFQQFQQLSSTSFGGSGLGLFISKQIATMHHGSLEFSSQGEGKGSSFKLLLPLFDIDNTLYAIETDDIESNTGTLTNVETKQQNTNDSTLIRICVCDDSSLNRKYLVKTLKNLLSNKLAHLQMTTTFQEVDDGAVLVSYLENTKNNKTDWPTIIFMDNIMMDMNGPDATRNARKLGFDGLIVGVSGNMMSDDVSQFFDAGCSHFIGKPVDVTKLETIFLELDNRLKHDT